MIDEKHVVAMNKEIDGMNTQEESARLRDFLGSHDEARAYFEDLSNLGNMLSGVQMVEAPPTLKAGIMSTIHEKQQIGARPVAPPKETWFDTMRGGFQHPSRWAFGFSFAAGVAFGIIGYAAFGDGLSPPSPIADHRFAGSMAPFEASAPVDRLEFDEAGVTGHIETRSVSDRFLTKIAVNSERDLEIVIEFDGNVLSPIGFEQETPGAAEIAVGAERVRLSHRGSNVYVFTMGYPAMTASEVQVKFYSGGLLFEKALNTLPAGP